MGKGVLECVMCLNKFENYEELRLLPHCNHDFYLDCIDACITSHVTCFVYCANLVEQIVNDNLDLLHVATLATNMVGLQSEIVVVDEAPVVSFNRTFRVAIVLVLSLCLTSRCRSLSSSSSPRKKS
ncbi:hypothetical protein B296_00048075 [Ensete ventricosum]|uniref:RING-type E3 ubiquitin transferase n=1 Tax=Ensete ventricosum TaxID=4639 RepID=A0A426X8Z0_ENSVE|nr:hypothetical protein B296_00048075 [Ensete ventricosum]